MTQDCNALLQKLRAIDLAILETGLYLNAYDSEEAFSYYQSLIEERAALADVYTKTCAPLTKDTSCDKRRWTDSPWPWELEAN